VAEDKAKKGKKSAEEPENKAEGAEEEGAEGQPTPAKSKKKLFIILGLVTVLLLGGAGAGLYFTGIIGPKKTAEAGEGEDAADLKKPDKDKKAFFYDLGDMIVNLSGDGRRPAMLKLKISLELEDEKDKAAIDQIKPRVLDNFQVYLRELRLEDLKGSAGIYRLREELLLRVAEAAHPAKIQDVLITEMLVQ
jgi:flagellar protein FliL